MCATPTVTRPRRRMTRTCSARRPTSGAGGGKNSVAGSLAFNLVLISATASVGDSSVLTFAGGTGDLTLTAGSKSVSTVKALPGTEAGASGEAFGLGLSIAPVDRGG